MFKVLYRFHKSLTLYHILRQTNTVHTATVYFLHKITVACTLRFLYFRDHVFYFFSKFLITVSSFVLHVLFLSLFFMSSR